MWIVDKICVGETTYPPSVGIEALNPTSICIEAGYKRLLGMVPIQFINEGNNCGDAPIRWPIVGWRNLDRWRCYRSRELAASHHIVNKVNGIVGRGGGTWWEGLTAPIGQRVWWKATIVCKTALLQLFLDGYNLTQKSAHVRARPRGFPMP